MKYCTYCGHPNLDNAAFCGKCGRSFEHVQMEAEEKGNGASSWVDQINDYVGNDRPADLNWKMLFTDVMKKHTKEEAEDIFICGTRTTTPALQDVSRGWPRPWLYSRVFFMFAMAFALLYVCCSMFGNSNALPGLIVVGSFTVPLATMILFLEVNAFRNISVYEVIQIFLVGGCASLVATLFLFSIFNVGDLSFWGALMVGVIEEVGKAVIVYYFIKRIGKYSILSGMLIGASVGAGFAAFESAGYAMNFLVSAGWDVMMDVIFLRGFLAPGGHVTWAAITGAAMVIAYKNSGTFGTEILTDKKFLRLFLIPVLLHALWDSPLAQIGSEVYLIPIALTAFVWIVVLILINMGLAEISHYRNS